MHLRIMQHGNSWPVHFIRQVHVPAKSHTHSASFILLSHALILITQADADKHKPACLYLTNLASKGVAWESDIKPGASWRAMPLSLAHAVMGCNPLHGSGIRLCLHVTSGIVQGCRLRMLPALRTCMACHLQHQPTLARVQVSTRGPTDGATATTLYSYQPGRPRHHLSTAGKPT